MVQCLVVEVAEAEVVLAKTLNLRAKVDMAAIKNLIQRVKCFFGQKIE